MLYEIIGLRIEKTTEEYCYCLIDKYVFIIKNKNGRKYELSIHDSEYGDDYDCYSTGHINVMELFDEENNFGHCLNKKTFIDLDLDEINKNIHLGKNIVIDNEVFSFFKDRILSCSIGGYHNLIKTLQINLNLFYELKNHKIKKKAPIWVFEGHLIKFKLLKEWTDEIIDRCRIKNSYGYYFNECELEGNVLILNQTGKFDKNNLLNVHNKEDYKEGYKEDFKEDLEFIIVNFNFVNFDEYKIDMIKNMKMKEDEINFDGDNFYYYDKADGDNINLNFTFIFYGKTGLGKTYISNRIMNSTIYETDKNHFIPENLDYEIVVVGTKYDHKIEDIIPKIKRKYKILTKFEHYI